MTVWALSWGEIIGRARTDMQLVREHLEQKSRELSVSTYLQENYPDILPGVSAAGRGPSTRNGPEA
jgi:hypothetical protein